MKRSKIFISVVLILVIICSVPVFTSCQNDGCSLSTELFFSTGFSGYKTISLKIPNKDASFLADLNEYIDEYCPNSISVQKPISSDFPVYDFKIVFSSVGDYKEKLEEITGENPSVFFRNQHSIFADGTSFKEYTTSEEILGWLLPAFDLKIVDSTNMIYFNNEHIETTNQAEMFRMTGNPINDISMYTVNNGDGTFNRTFVFDIPYVTIANIGEDINSYFNARLISPANTSTKTNNGVTTMSFSFENLDLEQLYIQTQSILNVSDDTDIKYEKNLSFENLFRDENIFSESINLSGYCSGPNIPVKANYRYQSENNDTISYSTNGESIANINGSSLDYVPQDYAFSVDIVDGNDIPPQTVQISLYRVGDKGYTKDFAFAYSPENTNAMNVYNTLAKYVDVSDLSFGTENELEVCHLSRSGSIEEINNLFSFIPGNNELVFNQKDSGLRLANSISLTDNIDLSAIKNVTTCPSIDYTVYTDSIEFIEGIKCTSGSNVSYTTIDKDTAQKATFTLTDSVSSVEVGLKRANVLSVTLFLLAVIILTAVVIFAMRYLEKRNKKN